MPRAPEPGEPSQVCLRGERGEAAEVQRGEVKRSAGVEGKSAGPAPGPHTDGETPGPATMGGPATPQGTPIPPQSLRLSYIPPHPVQETRGICSHLNPSPFTTTNILVPQILPHGDYSNLPQVRPSTTQRVLE